MSREHVRELKRGMRQPALAESAALALLERSISFGHARLAVIRLVAAVTAGAPVSEQHWAYCGDAAMRSGDAVLVDMFERAVARARQQLQAH